MQVKNCVHLALLAGLAGGATLPSGGPRGRQIEKTALAPKDGGAPIQLVRISTIADVPVEPAAATPALILPDRATPPTDMVGPVHRLDINIPEAGITLFPGSSDAVKSASQLANTPGVQVQKLTPMRVDDPGDISVPYAGTLDVAGLAVGEVEVTIRKSLQRVSENAHVLITMNQAITNSIIVGGEVAKPGRLVLQTNREALSDVVALAGGYRGNSRDLTLRMARSGKSVDRRMTNLAENAAMYLRASRTFSVLDAPGRVAQLPFTRSSVSLTEEVATAGRVNLGAGNPAAVFLFRCAHDAQGKEVPIMLT